jgi:UDP-GlcNAc:undecaprenyl-phosphate GlcNAc-1-phosphate transferase
LIVFFFGVIDDRRGLSAPWKLLGQLLGTGLMISLGVQIHLFDQYPWLDLVITVLWMVGITNAYNFVDSMDGLANGLACLAAAFFMLVTFDSGQGELSVFSALLFGACVGVYYFTFPPARFFLGDSGAQMLGFLLAGLAIAYTPLGFLRTQSWYIPILLMGVPIFDTTLIVVSRLRRSKPIYRAGQDHTYHRLVKLGLDSNRAALTMQFVAGFLGCLAFITLSLPPLAANIVFFACLIGGFLGIIFLDSQRVWQD